MAIRRVPIESVADPEHGRMQLYGDSRDILPRDRVYVGPRDGRLKDGRRGDTLADLGGDEIEIPRTTWYAKK